MPRKLLAFLEEKQEPFALEVYLLERGYIRSSFNSEHNFPCCSSKNYTKIFKILSSSNLHKKRKSIKHCPKVVKTVLSKIVSFKNQHKLKNSISGDQNGSDRHLGETMSNSLGSQRSCAPLRCPHISTQQFVSDLSHSDLEFKHTMPNSCSNSYAKGTTNGTIYIENSSLVLKDDKELARRDVEDSNQLSPVSVLLLELQETHCDVTKPVLKTRNYVKRIQESSLAIPSSKLENPFESSSKGMQEVISSNFLAHHTNNKKAVLHSKPLLLDCVRETVEDQRKKQRNVIGQHFQKILEAEELWNHIYENICLWSKDTIDDTNIEHLLQFDLLASMEEWNNCEEQRSEIGEAIVNATLNDIINEIIS